MRDTLNYEYHSLFEGILGHDPATAPRHCVSVLLPLCHNKLPESILGHDPATAHRHCVSSGSPVRELRQPHTPRSGMKPKDTALPTHSSPTPLAC
eukprot:scaffold23500_cov117-Isochrysis_galbana.AAC.2